jgi:hypothetical protein
MNNEFEKKNFITINFRTKEVKEDKLEPVSNFVLVKIAKMICHYINHLNRLELSPAS